VAQAHLTTGRGIACIESNIQASSLPPDSVRRYSQRLVEAVLIISEISYITPAR